MMAVKMTVAEGKLRAGAPVELFEGNFLGSSIVRGYDVTQGGQRFLMIQYYPDESQVRADEYFGKKVGIVLN